MGSRGPLRERGSTRELRERRKPRKKIGGEAPQFPDWLPEKLEGLWDSVVTDLDAARVPLHRIDGHAIGFYVSCIQGARNAAEKGDARLLARFSRDAIAWGNLIGANPASRARLRIDAEDSAAIDANLELEKILSAPRTLRFKLDESRAPRV